MLDSNTGSSTGPELVSLGLQALREALDPAEEDPSRVRLVAALYILDRGALPRSPEQELARMMAELEEGE